MNKSFSLENPMPPQWLRYPQFHPASMGWRMGKGEDYLVKLWDWLESMTDNEREIYNDMFPQPKIWDDDAHYYYVDIWNKSGEPKYSKEYLIRFSKNHQFIFFWKPSSEPEAFLGQWQPTAFEDDFGIYCCAEQYMMANKAQVFGDVQIRDKIMDTTDPREMKVLGKKVKNFKNSVWDKVKYWVVVNGNYHKFAQNKEMRDFLLMTQDKILVEASPYDTIWGIGLDENDPKVNAPNHWKGLNLLGFALMEVRDEIQRVYKNYDKIDWSQFKD